MDPGCSLHLAKGKCILDCSASILIKPPTWPSTCIYAVCLLAQPLPNWPGEHHKHPRVCLSGPMLMRENDNDIDPTTTKNHHLSVCVCVVWCFHSVGGATGWIILTSPASSLFVQNATAISHSISVGFLVWEWYLFLCRRLIFALWFFSQGFSWHETCGDSLWWNLDVTSDRVKVVAAVFR